MISVAEISALLQVIMVDLVLAGDNAIVVGMVAAGLPREQRGKVIFIGIAAATVLRVVFAVITSQLLQIIGLTLAGGILLLWVCWKLWRELRQGRPNDDDHMPTAVGPVATADADANGRRGQAKETKTFRQAAFQIVLADVS